MLDGHAWAISAVDATGSFSSGLLWGNRFWMGSQEECNDLNMRYIDFISNGSSSALSHFKYVSSLNRNVENTGSKQSRRDSIDPASLSKMILLDNTPPYEMSFSAVILCLNITKTTLYSSHVITMGICLPRICQEHDIHELLDFSIKTYQNIRVSGSLPRTAKILNVRKLNNAPNISHNPKFIFFCCAVVLLLVLAVIGTLVDVYSQESDSSIKCKARETTPTFKSFIQIDSIVGSNNRLKILNESQAHVHMTQMAEQKSLESFHTIDGLIPNKYTEIVSDYQFHENSKNQVSLVMKTSDSNSGCIEKEYENFNNPKKKYTIATDEAAFKFVNNFNGIRLFQMFNCVHRETLFAKLIMCFSLKTNSRKIFSTDIGEDTLSPVHGMKFISILWVILVHTSLVIFQLSDNKVYRGKVETNFIYQIIGNGTFSVDTFFVLSGVLISYIYCQTIKKSCSAKNTIDVSGTTGNIVQFFIAISYRYLRLTPAYLFTIGLTEYVSKYFNSHYALELPGRDNENCEKYWWRNVLYINTFYPLNESCMSWSWYLANDTQFYIIGVMILIISFEHLKTAATFFIGLLLLGWATTAMVALKTGYTPSIEDPFSHYDELYNKPWTRIGPYLVGIFTGWFLSKTNCCLLISKKLSAVLWLLSISLLFGIIFGVYGTDFKTYGSVAYASFSHTAWGISISWILIACVTGYGGLVNKILSCPFIYPLSRLSYCAYLLHPVLLKIIFISSGSIQHISPEIIGIIYIGFLFFTFAAALIFSLLFEAPSVSLLRFIHPAKDSLRNTDS
ncbi:O-acyltransferase like protein-like isoform X2 [Arctopsyche grandis]